MIIEKKFQSIDYPFVSLHDSQITQIICNRNSIKFIFDKGFMVIEDGQLTIHKGYVEINNCSLENVICRFIHRKTGKNGAKFWGCSITPDSLIRMINRKHYHVEVIEELYVEGLLYWRCGLLKKKSFFRKLNPYIIIEINDNYSMSYTCE